MKKTTFLWMLSLLWMGGCTTNDDDVNTLAPTGAAFTKNFIQTYVLPESITVQEYHKNRYLEVEFKGQELNNRNKEVKAEYDKVSVAYKDTTYNNDLVPYTTFALGEDCMAIDIVCNKAIDAAHPAGTSLKDMVKLCATSYRNFIYNNYITPSPCQPMPEEFNNLALHKGLGSDWIFSSLGEMTSHQFVLIEPILYLYMPTIPAGEYEFTVTATFAQKSLTDKVTTTIK